MKKQMKDTQNEIQQNIQGTNSDRKETIWNKRGKKNPTKPEWRNKNSKKWRDSYKPLDNLKHSDIQIIGVPEGEE